MCHQRVLDLHTSYVFAAADDHVFDAVNDVEVAVIVETSDVAGTKPTVCETLGVEIVSIPVTAKHCAAADTKFAARTGWRNPSGVVDDLDIEHGRATPCAGRMVEIILPANFDTNRISFGHTQPVPGTALGKLESI